MEKVLITGAGRGLGLALTRCFLKAGYQVYAGLLHPDQPPDLPGEDLERVTFLPLDVARMDSIRAAAASLAAQTASLDVLINNAGVFLVDKSAPLEDIDLDDGVLETSMTINAYGPLRVTQQFLPFLQTGGRKLIVNVSSESGSIGDCWRSREFAYSMSKAALNMATRLVYNYLAPQGFQVLAVHPGWLQTDMGGPGAIVPAADAADQIYSLTQRAWTPQDPIFMDAHGTPLPW